MTITIVKGLLGKTGETSESKASQSNPTDGKNLIRAAQQVAVRYAGSSDAAIVTIKASRSSDRAEKIDSPQKAEGVAKDIADRVRGDKEEAINAHGGSPTSSLGETLA